MINIKDFLEARKKPSNEWIEMRISFNEGFKNKMNLKQKKRQNWEHLRDYKLQVFCSGSVFRIR